MKKKIIIPLVLASLATSAFAVNSTKPIMHLQKLQAENQKDSSKSSGNNFIQPGIGYSSDAQSLAQQNCFAFTDTAQSAGQGRVLLDAALSYNDLQKELKTGASASGGIGLFGGGFSIDYLHAMRDTDFSYSLNYLNYATNKVSVNLDLSDGGLTPTGKTLYDNVHDKFDISCGDEIVTAYKTGAMLLFGINLKFHNHTDLETFKASAHGSYGSIFSASAYIETFAKTNNINATVAINAYQVGGKPERLAGILSKDPKGSYYALNCSMKDMTNCIKAAEGLLDYASSQGTHTTNGFEKQFDLSQNENLEPFGIGFADTMDMELIGLDVPQTLVTPEVKQARENLGQDLKRNEYYENHLGAILNGYPVALDSQYKEKLNALYTKAENNVSYLTNPVTGGIQCFTKPYKCVEIAQEIESNLKQITDEEIEGVMELIDYTLNISWSGGDQYPTGTATVGTWDGVYKSALYPTNQDAKVSFKFNDLISKTGLNFESYVFYGTKSQRWSWAKSQGFMSGAFPNYSGKSCFGQSKLYCETHNYTFKINPYYFTPYQADDSESK